MIITKTFKFEAAHSLSRHQGKCFRLHGHSYKLTVCVEGVINPTTGFILDYGDISKIVKPLVEQLDHHYLGDRFLLSSETYDNFNYSTLLPPSFYPTAENLAKFMFEKIDEHFDMEGLLWVEIQETENTSARYPTQ